MPTLNQPIGKDLTKEFVAYLAADLDGVDTHMDVGLTKEIAQSRAGEHCTDLIGLIPIYKVNKLIDEAKAEGYALGQANTKAFLLGGGG
jgi:hypothetical protein